MSKGKTCSYYGCQRQMVAKGFCYKHYSRARRHGNPDTVKANFNKEYNSSCDLNNGKCRIYLCTFGSYAKGICRYHYNLAIKGEKLGQIDLLYE